MVVRQEPRKREASDPVEGKRDLGRKDTSVKEDSRTEDSGRKLGSRETIEVRDPGTTVCQNSLLSSVSSFI